MFKKILGVLLGLLVLLLIIVAMAPAKTVIPFVQAKLPKKLQAIQFNQVEGSIWAPQISTIRYQQHKVENVTLDIAPLSLLAGKLALDVNVADPSLNVNGHLNASSNTIELESLNHVIQAERLNPFMEFPVKGLAGKLEGIIEQAEFNQDGSWNSLLGHGTWADATIYYFNTQLALGDIQYQLNTDETKTISLEIIGNQGALDLKGNFKLAPDKSYQLDFSTQEQVPDELATWIKRLGKYENNRYRILWKGKLK